MDVPIAINHTGTWPAVFRDGHIVINSSEEDARLLGATVLEMSHPVFGQLRGLYPETFDAYLVLPDYTTIKFNTEENPGHIYTQDRLLEPPVFDLVLWNPVLCNVSFRDAFSGLTSAERTQIWQSREAELRRKLRISSSES